jgi:hypothetical protein
MPSPRRSETHTLLPYLLRGPSQSIVALSRMSRMSTHPLPSGYMPMNVVLSVFVSSASARMASYEYRRCDKEGSILDLSLITVRVDKQTRIYRSDA